MISKKDKTSGLAAISEAIASDKAAILQRWLTDLLRSGPTARIDRATLEDLCSSLLDQSIDVMAADPLGAQQDLPQSARSLLAGISINFAERGFTPSQTATFVMGLKDLLQPVFPADSEAQRRANGAIDRMALCSMDAFIQRREHILRSQSQEILDISVPVVPLWEGILSLPIIGTLDSGRAQAITEKLLFELARTNSRHAILDISGVPTVDTQTAQYLGKTVSAARLMGAECVITGIRPAIAQVMVALGINLATIQTRFSLAEGLRYCFAQQGFAVQRQAG